VPVLVMRCDEGDALVPSRVVRCSACGADCWLSRRTGAGTLARARASGDGKILCGPCLSGAVDADRVQLRASLAVLDEARDALKPGVTEPWRP